MNPPKVRRYQVEPRRLSAAGNNVTTAPVPMCSVVASLVAGMVGFPVHLKPREHRGDTKLSRPDRRVALGTKAAIPGLPVPLKRIERRCLGAAGGSM